MAALLRESDKKIIRVFPRKTNATPIDELVRIGKPPGFFDEADEVHISVAFSWDMPHAERLAKAWESVAPVKIGGPATGEAGGDFVPGLYIKQGYVITSRGCPNRCWFCSVPKREGDTHPLPITEGFNVLDDNLLACSEEHIRAVFAMLKKQNMGRPEFTGGLEAARLKDWHVELLAELKPKQIFFAYDTPNDYEPLVEAGKMLKAGGVAKGHVLRAYNLCGYPGDTFERAEKRIKQTVDAGFMPMAMLYRDETGECDRQWKRWQREWANPVIIGAKMKAKKEVCDKLLVVLEKEAGVTNG